ncbi:MAG: hypothetical protein JWQ19_2981 [Subtercola sp.]|nr:hypothetical protein [Subtercola sp.]
MRVKPALASVRTIDILNFMSVNSGRSFSMTELAAVIEVNAASTSQILLALTEAGYLIRHPRHKTFELGPALVATGHAASERHPIVELARPVLAELAPLGKECHGSALVGNEVIVLAIAGVPSQYAWKVRVGQRVPFIAPYAAVYAAYGERAVQKQWMRGYDKVDPSITEHLERSLQRSRARGYTVGLYSPELTKVSDLYARLGERPHDEQLWESLMETISQTGPQFILDTVEPDERYTVSSVAAPVFGVDGTIVYALTIAGIGPVDGHEINRIGQTLSDACRSLTRKLGGREPESGL